MASSGDEDDTGFESVHVADAPVGVGLVLLGVVITGAEVGAEGPTSATGAKF